MSLLKKQYHPILNYFNYLLANCSKASYKGKTMHFKNPSWDYIFSEKMKKIKKIVYFCHVGFPITKRTHRHYMLHFQVTLIIKFLNDSPTPLFMQFKAFRSMTNIFPKINIYFKNEVHQRILMRLRGLIADLTPLSCQIHRQPEGFLICSWLQNVFANLFFFWLNTKPLFLKKENMTCVQNHWNAKFSKRSELFFSEVRCQIWLHVD